MKLSLTTRPVSAQTGLVIFVQDKKPLCKNTALAKAASERIRKTGFSGDCCQTLVFQNGEQTVILSGLGEAKHFQMEYLERAAATAVRTGQKNGLSTFTVETAATPRKISEPDFVRAVARGAAWGTYRFSTFKTGGKKRKTVPSLTFSGPCKNAADCKAALKEAGIEAEALTAVADIANSPGNEATPQKIANRAQKLAKENGLTCSILSKADLKKKNCNAILAVAAGSAQDAKIITLKYKGTNPKAKPVIIVGKTITFDSGGISLKPGKGMSWMLYDKCGGMAVLAAMQMVAQLKPSTPVIGMLAVAENMPGGHATRPGDIIKSHAGKTIEILNTDAEGRLALCDALSLAQQYKPAVIVDLATLTGACIVALGHTASAVIGNNAKLTQTLIKAGASAGERLWELPLWQEHMDDMKGTFADLQNIGKSGTAGTITAGAFLAHFIPDNIPWAHLDIAGTAWEESPKPWMDPGATLFGARTLIEWIRGI